MKYVYILILVCLGVGGYVAYKEGDLASYHPLLDPNSRSAENPSEEDESGNRGESPDQSDGDDQEARRLAELEKDEAKKLAAARKEQEKAERESAEAEEKRMAAAEKERAAAAKRQAAEAEKMRKAQQRQVIQAEVDALDKEYNALRDRITETRNKMSQQEVAWRRANIKTREADKEKVREAAKRFETDLVNQSEKVYQQLRDKRRKL